MTEAGCAFCAVVAALEHSEACPARAAHLHWHLFPRYDWDPNPKGPIWETSHTPRVASPQEYADTLAAIRRHLA